MKKKSVKSRIPSHEVGKALKSVISGYYDLVNSYADVLAMRSTAAKGTIFIIQLPKT